MNVVDAEYQFDRHKLTFFFEANGRVDFRELVRDLFSIYKTRIWMQQIDKNSNSLDSVVTNERVARNDFRFGSNFDMPTANTFNNMQAGSA
jgi:cell fate regulator YaaT (PSP1 superfamily)